MRQVLRESGTEKAKLLVASPKPTAQDLHGFAGFGHVYNHQSPSFGVKGLRVSQVWGTGWLGVEGWRCRRLRAGNSKNKAALFFRLSFP